MKSKILAPAFFFILFFGNSCKKENVPGIVGSWLNTSIYLDNGQDEPVLITDLKFPQRLSLDKNARFQSFTDIPEGSGTYVYNRNSNELKLNFEATAYAPAVAISVMKVAYLNGDKLVTVSTHPNGVVQKKEYIRVD